MNTVKKIPWTNRLAALVMEPGGMRASDAIARADANLEAVRDDCIAAIDRHLERIEELHGDATQKATPAVKDEMYERANEIHGLAGIFGLGPLGEAAFSLCELLDRLRATRVWKPEAVDVHLSALRLLRHPPQGGGAEAMLQGLRTVTDRVPKPAAW